MCNLERRRKKKTKQKRRGYRLSSFCFCSFFLISFDLIYSNDLSANILRIDLHQMNVNYDGSQSKQVFRAQRNLISPFVWVEKKKEIAKNGGRNIHFNELRLFFLPCNGCRQISRTAKYLVRNFMNETSHEQTKQKESWMFIYRSFAFASST